MKKTSVYLEEVHLERLRRAAERLGCSQANVIRDAIMEYTAKAAMRTRKLAMDGVVSGPGDSIEDLDEKMLLRGFGE